MGLLVQSGLKASGPDVFDNCPTADRRASSISSLIVVLVKSPATVKINPRLGLIYCLRKNNGHF